MKKKVWLVILLLFCAMWFVGCGREKAYKKPLTTVRVQPVEGRSETGSLHYSASIMPYTQVNLSFKVGGYIQYILQVKDINGKLRNVQEGDFVTQGAVLAKVRESDYIAKVNQAKSQLAAATASYNQAKTDFTRATNLFATQSITEKDYDGAKARFEVTQANVESAKALVEEAEIALQDCSLKAPMSSLVLKRHVEVGTLVSHGNIGFVVADTSSVKAAFGVPDLVLENLKLGSLQTVITEAFLGKEFRGRITSISPSADHHSRVFQIEITIPNPDSSLKAGMIVSLEVAGKKLKKPVLVVPLNAIVRPKDNSSGYALYTIEEKEERQLAHIRNVKLGGVFGNMIEVTEGVKLGERIIVTGATFVIDGEQIKIVP